MSEIFAITPEQRIRIESLHAASRLSQRVDIVLARAKDYEAYILGTEETKPEVMTVKIFQPPSEAPHNNQEVSDLTGFIIQLPGQERHTHLPVQHRDRKPRWCDFCKLTAFMQVPKARSRDLPLIHDEPDCDAESKGCSYPEPHRHGFACDKTCEGCHRQCHPDCPAFEEHHALRKGGDELLVDEVSQRPA